MRHRGVRQGWEGGGKYRGQAQAVWCGHGPVTIISPEPNPTELPWAAQHCNAGVCASRLSAPTPQCTHSSTHCSMRWEAVCTCTLPRPAPSATSVRCPRSRSWKWVRMACMHTHTHTLACMQGHIYNCSQGPLAPLDTPYRTHTHTGNVASPPHPPPQLGTDRQCKAMICNNHWDGLKAMGRGCSFKQQDYGYQKGFGSATCLRHNAAQRSAMCFRPGCANCHATSCCNMGGHTLSNNCRLSLTSMSDTKPAWDSRMGHTSLHAWHACHSLQTRLHVQLIIVSNWHADFIHPPKPPSTPL